jgi:hypothetical protein
MTMGFDWGRESESRQFSIRGKEGGYHLRHLLHDVTSMLCSRVHRWPYAIQVLEEHDQQHDVKD